VVIGALTGCMGLTIACAGAGPAWDRSERRLVVGPETSSQLTSTDESPRSADTCDFLPLRPTYLPWLSEEDEVPPPHREYEANQKVAGLYWWRRTGTPPYYVSLVVTTGESHSHGDPIGVSLGGDVGEFNEGEATSGYVEWEKGRRTCNYVALHYVHPPDKRISQAEIRDQLIKVAESLQ
jgi:hypothetical protein